MIFPNAGPDNYDEKHRDILKRMEAFYAESISVNQNYWEEASVDTRFESGDQTIWADIYGFLPMSRRRPFSFNRIRRVVNMITGHQRRNRKSTIIVPVENGDMQTADQFTKIMMWLNQQEGILETVSESFHGAVVSGMNLMQVWIDYRNDPISGNIKVDNCSYNSFLIDPFFKKKDLSDCSGLWKRSFLTKRECASLLPDHAEEILSFSCIDIKDGKFQFMPENYDYGRRDLLQYDEYYYRDYRNQRMLVDSQTGESTEWKGKDEEDLRRFLQIYPQISVIDQQIPTVKLAIVVQGHVMYDGPNPLGIDRYPFVPVFSYYTPQLQDFTLRVQGVVRGLRDAQYLYNRRRAIELDILESQVNSGWVYKEDALVNPKDVFLNGQGRGIALKKDALISDVQQVQPPQIPPSMIQLSEMLAQEVQQISGVNEELLGSAVDDKAGILSMLRQGAGLTTLQGLFDNLDHSQRLLGRVILEVIQANFTPGKVKRIIEEEPTAQFYNKAFGTYDAAVEEGLNTTTQRQMQFAQLISLREAGVPIPDDVILEASTMQNKKKLIESVQAASQKKAEMEQMSMQVGMQEQMAKIELAQARAAADRGLGIERASRVEENKAFATERLAEASKDRMAGLLNLVKALQEIDNVDLNQIQQLLSLSDMVRNKERVDNAQQNEDSNQLMQGAVNQNPMPEANTPAQGSMSEMLAGGQAGNSPALPEMGGNVGS